MFQITSGLSRSRLVRSSVGLGQRKVERAQHVEAFMRLAQIGMGFLDDRRRLRRSAARPCLVIAATSGSTGVMPRSGE